MCVCTRVRWQSGGSVRSRLRCMACGAHCRTRACCRESTPVAESHGSQTGLKQGTTATRAETTCGTKPSSPSGSGGGGGCASTTLLQFLTSAKRLGIVDLHHCFSSLPSLYLGEKRTHQQTQASENLTVHCQCQLYTSMPPTSQWKIDRPHITVDTRMREQNSGY